MSDLNKLVKISLFFLAFLLLPACALSPQTIQISPDLTPTGIGPVSGTTLALDVQDQRRNPVVGYRGGIYTTAAITTEDNVAASIRTELSRVLSGLGYSIVKKGTPAGASLDIELQKLDYKATQENILWKVHVSAQINAEVSVGTKTISNNFEDRLTKEFATAPSMLDNEKLINKEVSGLLQRILTDQDISKLLSSGSQ
jgi:uncharacterized lipoprotein